MDIKKKINELTIEEKITLLTGFDGFSAIRLDNKHLYGIQMSDGPNGVKTRDGDSVCYPNTCLMASSWDKNFCFKIGEMLGDDCNRLGIDLLLAPSINIKRNPLCGRNFEYYSEDPLLTGSLAVEYINGIKSKKVGVCLKHFACNSREENRWIYNSVVDEDTLRNIYLKAFEIVLKNAKVDCVMAAYNKLNGEYCCQNRHLLNDILRKEWRYEGVVVSDWCAINDIVQSFKAGIDLEMPGNKPTTFGVLMKAYQNGEITLERINEIVEKLLKLYIELQNKNKKTELTSTNIYKEKYLRKKVAESFVLLKNEKLLPFQKSEKIVVIGQGAKSPRIQGGGCAKMKTKFCQIPFLEMKKISNNLVFFDFNEVEKIEYKEFDKVALFLTMDDKCDSESIDRDDLLFPDEQMKALEYVLKNHNKVVAVLQNGSSVDLKFDKKIGAILETYYGGSYGGGAIADVLFGKTNPCGKLAETFYQNVDQIPFDCKQKIGNIIYSEREQFGYRYYFDKNLKAKYSFGFGLSYSNIIIKNVEIYRQSNYNFNVKCILHNDSDLGGKQVIQIYVKTKDKSSKCFNLINFKKVSVGAKKENKVAIKLDKNNFYKYFGGKKLLIEGNVALCVGTSSSDIIYEKKFILNNNEKMHIDENTPLKILLTNKKFRNITLKYMKKALFNWAFGYYSKDLKINDIENDAFLCSSIYNMPMRSFVYVQNSDFDVDKEKELIKKLNS